jgi:hypothetical protein
MPCDTGVYIAAGSFKHVTKYQSKVTLVAKTYRLADFGDGQVRHRQQMFRL